MPRQRGDLIQGTLDLLVLKVLTTGPMHGYGIAARIYQLSDEALRVEEGSLYPALYRLEERKLVRSAWRQARGKQQAKFYTLTRHGQRALGEETETWDRLSSAVARVLKAVEQGG